MCDRNNNYTLDAVKLISNDYDTFTPGNTTIQLPYVLTKLAE